jgi:hypothetical protein
VPRKSIFEEDYSGVFKRRRKTGRKRRTAGESLAALQGLVKENGRAVWEQGAYRFLFPDGNRSVEGGFGSYFWQGRELYITYAEALHLYERLVLGKRGRQCTTNGMLRILRQRFGDTFLAEYLPLMKQMKRKGKEV